MSIPILSKTRKIDNVLCASAVNKNLIYVYHLCNANKVFVEFFPAHFQVKGLRSGAWLALRSYLTTNSISHLTTPPHTPKHNALYERKHRHIVKTVLSLLSTANMPLKFWPQAFTTAVFPLIDSPL